MKTNGMVYTFSEEEIEAVGRLIRWAKEYKQEEAKETTTRVAAAFNRPFFERKFIDFDKND
jgi:hypothetical protein